MITVVAAIIRRQDRILITRRAGGVHLSGLWEFPGGKVEPGESLIDALQREIFEELGVRIRVDDEVLVTEHHYPLRSVRLHFFNCSIVEGAPRALEAAAMQWVSPSELTEYRFPEADAQLIACLSSNQ
jgi:mutator protein MutT